MTDALDRTMISVKNANEAIAAAVKKEREKCAKIAADMADKYRRIEMDGMATVCDDIATEIRTR
jgi:hypothetical protein